MPMPESDLLRIGAWCSDQSPAQYADELRVECEIADRHVTIFEARPPWDGEGDWIRTPIARIRYVGTTGHWSIYWADRHSRFHEYTRKKPTKRVQTLLDYIGSGADPIFWG